MSERTIIVDGVSKDFNLTAWRIGWVMGDASVVEPVARAHVYNGTLTGGYQQAGVIALLDDPDAIESVVSSPDSHGSRLGRRRAREKRAHDGAGSPLCG